VTKIADALDALLMRRPGWPTGRRLLPDEAAEDVLAVAAGPDIIQVRCAAVRSGRHVLNRCSAPDAG
jgi:hypothetical protein